MNILITGAYGFIGFHLMKKLVDQGHHVSIIDNYSKKQDSVQAKEIYLDFISKNNIYAIDHKIDLKNLKMLHLLFDNMEFDIVYHLAAINGTENFYTNPVGIIENNFIGTMNLLKAIKCKKFIFASSCETYASTINNNFAKIPTDENVLLSIDDINNPRWSYGGSKIIEELYVRNYCVENDIDFLILRYHNVYGPRDSIKHVIPALIDRAFNLKGNHLNIYGNDTRSFLYIKDCIEYTIMLAESKYKNDVYNIGNQNEVEIKYVAKIILENLNKHYTIIKINSSPKGSVKRRCPDMNKTIAAIKYLPKYTLKHGINEMIKYYKKEKCVV